MYVYEDDAVQMVIRTKVSELDKILEKFIWFNCIK